MKNNFKMKIFAILVLISLGAGCTTTTHVSESEQAVVSESQSQVVNESEKKEEVKSSPWGIVGALVGFAIGLAVF